MFWRIVSEVVSRLTLDTNRTVSTQDSDLREPHKTRHIKRAGDRVQAGACTDTSGVEQGVEPIFVRHLLLYPIGVRPLHGALLDANEVMEEPPRTLFTRQEVRQVRMHGRRQQIFNVGG